MKQVFHISNKLITQRWTNKQHYKNTSDCDYIAAPASIIQKRGNTHYHFLSTLTILCVCELSKQVEWLVEAVILWPLPMEEVDTHQHKTPREIIQDIIITHINNKAHIIVDHKVHNIFYLVNTCNFGWYNEPSIPYNSWQWQIIT